MAINQYTQALQTLSQPAYTPVPFQEMMQMGQYIQKRYDDSLLGQDEQLMKSAATDVIPDEGVKQFLDNKLNSFRTQQSELLDKYKGKTYSSDFQRESRKLIAQMAGDSDIKALQQYKTQYDIDDKYAADLRAKGVSFYDPRLNGQKYVDENGNLTPYKAGVRTLAHDEMIDEQGAKALQAMVQTGATTNNFKQLDEAYKASIQDNSKILQDKVAQLMQSGMSKDAATKSAKVYIKDRFDSFRKQDLDASMMKLYAEERAAKAAQAQLDAMNKTFPLGVGQTEVSTAQINGDLEALERFESGKSWWDTTKEFVGDAVATGMILNPAVKGSQVAAIQATRNTIEAKAQREAIFNKARGFLGAAAKGLTDQQLVKKYKDGLTGLKGARSYTTFGSENNKVNKELGDKFLNSGFQITKLDNQGKVQGELGAHVLTESEQKGLQFIGFGARDPKNSTSVSLEYVLPGSKSEEKYVVSLPANVANSMLPVASKAMMTRMSTENVADSETNMMGKEHWANKVEGGVNVTYVPIRTFEKGKPDVQYVRVKNPNYSTSLIEMQKGVKDALQKGNLVSIEAAFEEDVNAFLKDYNSIAPGLKTIED